MAISLKIENFSSLPDGGPLSIDMPGTRGIDFGRHQYLDWTLPDPTNIISGKHCEIRFRDGAYWLHDVSANGTYLNGAEERIRSPHRLSTGDRLEIGDYIIAVTINLDDGAAAAPMLPGKNPSPGDLWQVEGHVAPPLKVEPQRPIPYSKPAAGDFLDDIIDSSSPANDAFWNNTAQPSPVPRQEPQPFDFRWDQEPPTPPKPMPHSSLPQREFGSQATYWEAPPAKAAAAAPLPTAESEAVTAVPPPHVRSSPSQAAPGPAAGGMEDFVRLIAQGAGVSEAAFSGYTPAELAEELGIFLRSTTSNLKQLLAARSEFRELVRSSAYTMIVPADNNPLKFSPNVEEAINMMFGRRPASYLDARRAVEEGFNDLKQHQMHAYSSMQQAIGMIERDLDPKVIEAEAEAERGLSSMMISRKAKYWDAYAARWRLVVSRHENGLIGVFLDYLSQCYDKASTLRRPR
jgi:type VI secretion system protein ImpI